MAVKVLMMCKNCLHKEVKLLSLNGDALNILAALHTHNYLP